DRSEVGVWYVDLYVGGGGDVVVGDVGGAVAALDVGEVAQELRLLGPGGGDGCVLQRRHTVDSVLGRHHRDDVLHAALRVHPEIGGGLAAGGEGDEKVTGDVALAHAELMGAGAAADHAHVGRLAAVGDMGVDGARHARDLCPR